MVRTAESVRQSADDRTYAARIESHRIGRSTQERRIAATVSCPPSNDTAPIHATLASPSAARARTHRRFPMARFFTAATAACFAFALAACSGDGDSPSTPNNGGGNPTPVSSIVDHAGDRHGRDRARPRSSPHPRRTPPATCSPDARSPGRRRSAAIATVDANGLVTGVAVGTANIAATSEGKTAQAAITVSLVPVASVTVTPNAPSVKVGATVALSRDAEGRSGQRAGRSRHRLEHRARRPSRRSTRPRGVVTGVAAGTATLTATSEGKTGATTVTVSAAAKPVACDRARAGARHARSLQLRR